MSNKQKRTALIKEASIESEIFVSATHLSDQFLAETNQLLSVWGMTALQYNALKVLYVEDSENTGLSSRDIGQKLYTRVPDVTRLLDRLADKGWVTRKRDEINRRVVRTRLTQIGVELVESIYRPLMALEAERFDHLSDEEKIMLRNLLTKASNKGAD